MITNMKISAIFISYLFALFIVVGCTGDTPEQK